MNPNKFYDFLPDQFFDQEDRERYESMILEQKIDQERTNEIKEHPLTLKLIQCAYLKYCLAKKKRKNKAEEHYAKVLEKLYFRDLFFIYKKFYKFKGYNIKRNIPKMDIFEEVYNAITKIVKETITSFHRNYGKFETTSHLMDTGFKQKSWFSGMRHIEIIELEERIYENFKYLKVRKIHKDEKFKIAWLMCCFIDRGDISEDDLWPFYKMSHKARKSLVDRVRPRCKMVMVSLRHTYAKNSKQYKYLSKRFDFL